MNSFQRFFIVSVFLVFSASCVTSGDLNERYEDPTQIQTLDSAPNPNQNPPAASAASSSQSPSSKGAQAEELATRMKPVEKKAQQSATPVSEDMQRKLVRAQGQVEELQFQFAEQKRISTEREAELQKQLDEALLEIERFRKQSAVQVKVPSSASSSSGTKSQADILWDTGLAKLNSGDLETARASFSSIEKSYPKYRLAYGAVVLQGFILYKQKRYKEAALQFNTAIDRYPTRKRGVSLTDFGLASSVHRLGRESDAKIFFDDLIQKYPRSFAGIQAKKIIDGKASVPDDLFDTFKTWSNFLAR